jgi:hypothetical protein
VLKTKIKSRKIEKALGTADWLEAQRQLREMVTQAAEHVAKHNAWVQRGLAKTLSRVAPGTTVKIPRTSARVSQGIFAKLLTRVDPDAQSGFGFEGTVLRPGDELPLQALWPTPEHPKIPILLECAGAVSPKRGHGRRDQEDRYILWRFLAGRHEWQEIGRSSSTSWTWAIDLRPLAIRALEESRGKEVVVFVGLEQALARSRAAMDQELKQLAPPDRVRYLAGLHDEAAFRYVSFVFGTVTPGDRAGDVLELAPVDAHHRPIGPKVSQNRPQPD